MKSAIRPMYVYELIEKIRQLPEPNRSITLDGIMKALKTKEADGQT